MLALREYKSHAEMVAAHKERQARLFPPHVRVEIIAADNSEPIPIQVIAPPVADVQPEPKPPVPSHWPEIKYPKISKIVEIVSQHYGIPVIEIISHRRTAPIVIPRHVVMWLCRTMTLRSLPEIGRAMGNRDHTTILHGTRKIEHMRRESAALDQVLAELKRQITEATNV